MQDIYIDALTLALQSICIHVCKTENTSEVTVTPFQLWSEAKLDFTVSEEEVKANFFEVVKNYSKMIILYKPTNKEYHSCIDAVEKYIINGETDALFDEAEFVTITHTQEYINYLLNYQKH